MPRMDFSPNVNWYLTLIVLAVAGTVCAIWALRVWNEVKGEPIEKPAGPEDLLRPLTEAFASGQMTPEEYHRIRESIGRVGVASEPIPGRPLRAKMEEVEPPIPDDSTS